MASLVKGVYRMEKDRAKGLWKDAKHEENARTPRWWKTFHYEMIMLITEGDVVFGAVYHSLLDHHPHHKIRNTGDGNFTDYSAQGAPKIVVALRGTLLSKEDFEADIHILFHRLSSHKRFEMVLQVVRRQVAKSGPSAVCLTGHSKGAALALLVGRKLAEEGCYLEAHLFNPPNPSLPGKLPAAITLTAGVAHNIAANALAHVFQSENRRNHDRDTFLSIRTWMPNLYINAQYPLCSPYIEYFELSRQLPELKGKWFGTALSCTPRSIRGILGSSMGKTHCQPEHLIPSASLHVTHSASSFHSAHKLDQWFNLDLLISPLYFT